MRHMIGYQYMMTTQSLLDTMGNMHRIRTCISPVWLEGVIFLSLSL